MSSDSDTCPFCGFEYEIGASSCPACDLPLLEASEPARVGGSVAVVSAAPRPEYAVGSLRRVTVTSNQAEADMIESLLRSEGIPCIVRRTGGQDVPDFLAAGRRDILVPEGGFATARALLLMDDSDPVPAGPSPITLGAAVLACAGAFVVIIAVIAALLP
ncbi:MAG: DUF2007 domain-containing protein [Solirubrobacterales bacterium]